MSVLLDYQFDSPVASSDGMHTMTLAGSTVVAGPGIVGGETFGSALDMSSATAASVDIADVAVDFWRFRVRVVFQAPKPVVGRQNLIESDRLPCSLFLEPGDGGVDLVASVRSPTDGWRTATTRFAERIGPDRWHHADLVFDVDTLGLFVDGSIVDVQAFAGTGVVPSKSGRLYVGSWVDGQRDRFTGRLAGVRLDAGIPNALNAQIDERRTSARWHMTRKANALRSTFDVGKPTEVEQYRTAIGAWQRRHEHGLLMYHPAAGDAFALYGAIGSRYTTIGEPDSLGYLVSDEEPATDPNGRKSVFSSGAIYWSAATGAWEVDGGLYLGYEHLDESAALGFPISAATTSGGRRALELQRGHLYERADGMSANEVHGAILDHYLATGGPARWGFPVTDEIAVDRAGVEIGRQSEFAQATFLWSATTGVHEVHGAIRDQYLEAGGPSGDLGLPLTDEIEVDGAPGARSSRFQGGVVTWFGSPEETYVVWPFHLFIATLDTKEDEGYGQGQNDLFFRVRVRQGGTQLLNKRYPGSGDWGNRNVRDVNITLPLVVDPVAGQDVVMSMEVWDSDKGAPLGGEDDHLGDWSVVLNAANAWGLHPNQGIIDSGKTALINNIRMSVKPIDPRTLTWPDRFWGVENTKTPALSRSQYAQAFRDVDSETEWWDITDGIDSLFFEWVVKGIASDGNCFGMSLEAINALHGLSPFSLPLVRFKKWDVVRPTVNVKHAYQVGNQAIWWFVDEFLSGRTHDPVGIFHRTRDAAARNNHAVLCLSQDADFGGEPHCVLPVEWDDSGSPWRMSVLDPNSPGELRTVTVDPDAGTFRYVGSHTYTGGTWSGGRMYYVPWSILNRTPRTPIWDAILLLIGGTIAIVGSGAETTSISDSDDADIDATGSTATDHLRHGGSLAGHFVRFRGLGGGGPVEGEALFSTGTRDDVPGPVPRLSVADQPIGTIEALRTPLRGWLTSADTRDRALAHRTPAAVAADEATLRRLPAAARAAILEVLEVAHPGDIVHRFRTTRPGITRWMLKNALTEVIVEADARWRPSQHVSIAARGLGTAHGSLTVSSDETLKVRVEIVHRLGVAGARRTVRVGWLVVDPDKDVEVAIRPGLRSVDFVSQVGPEATVEIIDIGAQVTIRNEFNVPVGEGWRVRPDPTASNLVAVSRIPRMHGPVLSTEMHPVRQQ